MSLKFLTYSFALLFLLSSCSKDEVVQDEIPSDEPDYDFPNGKIIFSYPPLDLNGVNYFEPMGQLEGLPSNHGGAHHKELLSEDPTTTPLFAMEDGMIISWGHYFGDYWVVIKFSTTIRANYGHVGRFYGDLAEAFGPIQDTSYLNVHIPVEAGDTIGYVSPKSAFDIGIIDEEVVINYCYPEIYQLENQYCGLLTDYFNNPIKSDIIDLSMRRSAPYMGKVDYDVKGKMAGTWVKQGAEAAFSDVTFTIGYDHIFGNRIAISDGHRIANPTGFPNLGNVWVVNNMPNPDTLAPEHGMIKYECIFSMSYNYDADNNTIKLADTTGVDSNPMAGTFLLQMLEPELLKVEDFPDKSSSEVSGFTDNARLYVRKP